jgi:hypothetical protein
MMNAIPAIRAYSGFAAVRQRPCRAYNNKGRFLGEISLYLLQKAAIIS